MMPEWIGIVGTIGTFLFGGLYVWQVIREYISKQARQRERAHIVAVEQSLAQLRAMCTEAIEKGEIIKTDPTRQFVRQIAHSLLIAEGQLGAIEQAFMSDKERKKLAS